ncbi:conjugative transposon protein TraN [Niabella ginsengisoli]|uniref:Conjugative transposon protein TraN n=1 Tax=Niabella ginsengisoli TaxID=522298 RepID=A0ABS9SHS9_9BACT|nr:conjugative transposon protein TraN [Niabella ginsengisoli]MCH5597928.1 conjugative transposon protein TraN [Niabella ginsengisoli]
MDRGVHFYCACIRLGTGKRSAALKPYLLGISDTKTTNIIFPYAIKSVDRGAADVLVQKASGVENVLQIKAAIPDLNETNLTVITADGRFYSYLLHYEYDPAILNVKMEGAPDNKWGIFNSEATTDKISSNASRVFNKQPFIRSCKVKSYKIGLSLKGVYAAGGIIYFQLELKNNSWIDYPIRQLRLYIKDAKTAKRTASQEIEIKPAYILGNQKCIYSRSAQKLVIAVPGFTIPDKKKFLIEIQEANGGRHLQLPITNKKLTKAWLVF